MEMEMQAYKHLHKSEITIDTFWVNNVDTASDMELEIIVDIGHSGGVTPSDTINFTCKDY